MTDRVPGVAGRVKITPVNGDAYYAVLEMADNATVEGTPYNKASVLTDTTAEALGLDPNDDPTPNDAFGQLQNNIGKSIQTVELLSGSSYTLKLEDMGKILVHSASNSLTVTIPAYSSVAFPVGTCIEVLSTTGYTVTIKGSSGVYVNGTSAGSKSMTTSYGSAVLLCITQDKWAVQGSVS